MDNKILTTGIMLVSMVVSGFVLSQTGKPFNVFLLTAHKVISFGVFIYLAITVSRFIKVSPLSPIEIAVSVICVLLFIALVATGGMLSTTKTFPTIIQKIHQVIPYLFVISTVINLYLLQNSH
jgi:hypothetical protein